MASLFALLQQMAEAQSKTNLDLQKQLDRLAANQTKAIQDSTECTAAHIASLHGQMTQQSQLIAQNHRQLTLQILQLQNPTKKHYTRLTSLPREVVSRIFSWVPPRQVWRFRRLSRAFQAVISSKSFALQNMSSFVPLPNPATTESEDPTPDDLIYLFGPTTYQSEYIRKWWGKLKVVAWSLNNDIFHCPIPPTLMYAKQLSILAFEGCALTGTIPIDIGLLENLVCLNLSENSLDGPIPASISKLTKLQYLFLSLNQLSGGIPVALSQCTNLIELNLGNNPNLGGSLPVELGNLADLKYLELVNCSLTGLIPREFGRLVKLERLCLEKNALIGEVPVEFGELMKLVEVNCCENDGLTCSFAFRDDVQFSI
ncbi:hypothetical protein HDU98_011455 [Podochytrium sp. JEL0797]|nr:hypothetical protein HDU98_011455 [Podochytrium sp. JEL0797]